MPKKPKQERYPKKYRVPSEAYQAKQFIRPLQWLNKFLDALIQVLESQIKFGAPVTPGTKNLVTLLIEYKKRAIREGFENWFPEGDFHFSNLYWYLESINKKLSSAKKLSHDREACQASLGQAEKSKHDLIEMLFPRFLNVPFINWFRRLYLVDHLIERLDAAVRTSNISQKELIALLRTLRFSLDALLGVALNADDDDWGDDVRSDCENMLERCKFLLGVVRRGDWHVDKLEDRRKIRRVLGQLKRQKHRMIRRLGDYAGKSILDLYKELFAIDFHINNAADLWVNGRILPKWDPDEVIKIIRKAERAKLRFVSLLPNYLGVNLAWYYDHLYQMDVQLDLAKDLLEVGQIVDALKALRKVRQHKHAIEEVLETYF